MKESQAEIRAIQEKLRSLQMGRTRPPAAQTAPSDARYSTPQSQSIANTVEALRQQSNAYVQHLHPPLHLPAARPNPPDLQQRLASQVNQINELAFAQETALLELKAIADQIDRERKIVRQLDGDASPAAEVSVCAYLNPAVPQVDPDPTGTFVIRQRSIDVFRAEREAALTAQSLRRRARQTGRSLARRRVVTSRASAPAEGLLRPLLSLLPSRRRRTKRSTPAQSMPPLTVMDAAIWVIGATVARMGLDLLLAAMPHLWIPIVGMIAAPAAIAIYRTAFTPQVGFAWGYRLFLVMIGLLLGGRL